jgi:aconitate hydratase
MGVLPLQFLPGESAASHGLTGSEKFTIEGIAKIAPGAALGVTAVADDGTEKTFEMRCRLDSPVEVEYFRAGGIMNYVLGEMRK